jgi:hypothetical protein
MDMDVADALQARIMPTLSRWAEEITQQYPAVKASKYYDRQVRHNQEILTCGIGCLLLEAKDYPDEVDLSVVISPQTTASGVFADVSWGYPGFIEAEMPPTPARTPEEVIAALEASLPSLYEVLKDALRRGHPSSRP